MTKPISDRLLRRFCAPDISRRGDWTPTTIGRYTYATNGIIMIRVSAMAKYPHRDRNKLQGSDLFYEKVIPPMQGMKFVPLLLPYAPPSPDKCCHRCDGAKRVLHDGRREDCTVCDGTGRASSYDPVVLGYKFIAWHYLYLISLLQKPRIVSHPLATIMVPFRFTGGVGVVAQKLPT